LFARTRAGERLSGLASAALGAAVEISYHDQLFLAAQDSGAVTDTELAEYACTILVAASGYGLAAEEAVGMLDGLLHEAGNFLRYGDPFYRSLDLF
jgi:hypothetical protein